jgi:hypothetical protein
MTKALMVDDEKNICATLAAFLLMRQLRFFAVLSG